MIIIVDNILLNTAPDFMSQTYTPIDLELQIEEVVKARIQMAGVCNRTRRLAMSLTTVFIVRR